MADYQNPNSSQNQSPSPSKIGTEIKNGSKTPTEIKNGNTNTNFSGQKVHFPNPPDATNPDAATLREQWRFAIKQYSRWYSHAWGTAILAGLSFFALGWIIKGSNPLPSFNKPDSSSSSSKDDDKAET